MTGFMYKLRHQKLKKKNVEKRKDTLCLYPFIHKLLINKLEIGVVKRPESKIKNDY